jgi:hypothetical protein
MKEENKERKWLKESCGKFSEKRNTREVRVSEIWMHKASSSLRRLTNPNFFRPYPGDFRFLCAFDRKIWEIRRESFDHGRFANIGSKSSFGLIGQQETIHCLGSIVMTPKASANQRMFGL